jgi:hypothetical protein
MNIGDEENTCYKKLKEENKDIKAQIKYLINKCVKKTTSHTV